MRELGGVVALGRGGILGTAAAVEDGKMGKSAMPKPDSAGPELELMVQNSFFKSSHHGCLIQAFPRTGQEVRG